MSMRAEFVPPEQVDWSQPSPDFALNQNLEGFKLDPKVARVLLPLVLGIEALTAGTVQGFGSGGGVSPESTPGTPKISLAIDVPTIKATPTIGVETEMQTPTPTLVLTEIVTPTPYPIPSTETSTPTVEVTPTPTHIPATSAPKISTPVPHHSSGCFSPRGLGYSEAANPWAYMREKGFEWALIEGTVNDDNFRNDRISGYYIGNDGCYYPIYVPTAKEKSK